MVLVTQWSSGHYNNIKKKMYYRVLKKCQETFSKLRRQIHALVKDLLLIGVKMSILIRISEFPVNMHNFRPI